MKKIIVFCMAFLFGLGTLQAKPTLNNNLKPEQLRVYGEGNPVSLYVFTSYSCPHCTVFHKQVLPELMAFVEQGQAKITMVEMPYDARAMTGTALARCLPPKEYEAFSKAMFDNQRVWSQSANPKPIITGYAKVLGMSDGQINSCLTNKALLKKITEQRDNLSNLYGVTGMPTVVAVHGGKKQTFVGTDTSEILSGLETKFGLEIHK